MLGGKRVLLVIGGGIAAYKCLELIRRLRERGAQVRCVPTRAAEEFVTPLSLASLSGGKCHRDLFDLTDEAEMGHIQLSRDADLLVVAPATADLMAKMAHGLANDLASTLLMATDKPVLLAPAMNVRMWEHPATRRNLAILRADGHAVAGPNTGDMACGEYGPGRMAEPAEILTAIEGFFAAPRGPLAGKRVVVTCGPTHEPIDPVRYIANRSSGRQGMAITAALRDLGAQVTLISGPTDAPAPDGVETHPVATAAQMLTAVTTALPADAAVFAAAVADWRVAVKSRSKIRKNGSGKPPALELIENPDILRTVCALEPGARPALVVGFAAETDDVIANATAKRKRKGCDWILANDVSPGTGVMGGTENTVTLITEDGAETWPRMDKRQVAGRLAQRIAAHLRAHTAEV